MDFLSRVFGNWSGYLCVVTIVGGKHTEHYFSYPSETAALSSELSQWSSKHGTNVYFYPVLLEAPTVDSEIVCTPVIAADLDMINPVLVSPLADLIVESSPGRFQAYWFRNGHEFNPVSTNGAVKGDLNLKRIPGTKNWKYKGDAWLVREIDPASLDTFDRVASRRNLEGSGFSSLFRSNDRWSLARYCARLGCTAVETYLVLAAAQAGKGDSGHVSAGVLYVDAAEAVATSGIPSLLTDDEMASTGSEGSFVDRYVEWATSCTDSPRQYHIAGALMILSTLLSPHIRLPTSFGEFRVNLWFMILAGTTLTRKTTAMDMAVGLAKCINPDIVLTTNGPQEGIVAALGGRDGESSLFHRDEITGFISETAEKRYMTGVLEALTRLYDGGSERRTLSRRVVEINDPHFLILCGGIKSKTIDILTIDHVMSGFLPRFLIVCGWTRKEDMRPIGPPSQSTSSMRDDLIQYLEDMVKTYTPPLNGSKPQPLRMTATHSAWARVQKLEEDVHELGMGSDNPDIYCPMYERCMNSIIKVSILLAAERAYREGHVPELDLQDVVDAIRLSDVWIESMHEVVRGIENKPTKDELQLIRIASTVRNAPDGITRSAIMRQFRLSAREMNDREATLAQRGLVVVCSTGTGRGTIYRSATTQEV